MELARGYLIAWVKVTAYHPTTSSSSSLSSCTIYIHIYIHAPLLACCTVCLDRTSASSVEIPIRNGTGGGNFSTASLHRLSRYVVLASSGLLYRTFALRKLLDRWDRLEESLDVRSSLYLEERERESIGGSRDCIHGGGREK